MRLTKAQTAALVEAAGPRKYVYGLSYGSGSMRVDPRVVRSLRTLGMVEASTWDVREGRGFLTTLGWETGRQLIEQSAKKQAAPQ